MQNGTCSEETCPRPRRARGLCQHHYNVLYGAGGVAKRIPQSTLSEVDLEDRTGTCSKHGLVRIRVRVREGGTVYPACRRCSRGPRTADQARRASLRRRLAAIGQVSCQICSSTEALVVDHDHECCPNTSACSQCTRGLLCRSCNLALGYMRDRPDLLIRAVDYLRERPLAS